MKTTADGVSGKRVGTAKPRQTRQTRQTRASPAIESALEQRVYSESGRSVAWLIRDIHRLYTAALAPLVSRGGVTVGHWYYLRILSEHDGIIQQNLSARVGIHPNTAVPALVSMEKHGLIRRERSSDDRRSIKVHLTSKGRRLRDEMQPVVRDFLHESIAGVPAADLEAAFRVLDHIFHHLSGAVPDSVRRTICDEI